MLTSSVYIPRIYILRLKVTNRTVDNYERGSRNQMANQVVLNDVPEIIRITAIRAIGGGG